MDLSHDVWNVLSLIDFNEREITEQLLLNNCKLRASDLVYVCNVVKLLPNCKLIDLSFNCFEDLIIIEKSMIIISFIKTLLKNCTVLFTGNMVTPDLIEMLTNQELSNLIWVEERFLETGEWRQIFNNQRKIVKRVLRIHKKYYANKDSLFA